MALDPQVKRLLDLIGAGSVQDGSALTVAKMREANLQLARMFDAKGIDVATIDDRAAPGPGGPIPVRVYTPGSAADRGSAALVYFHGGTGVFGSVATHDGLCRMLANESACRVVSVDYRLAPEHRFPAAVQDSYAATRWVSERAADLGVDPARIAIGGDSAGGTLATVVCQRAAREGGPRIALQVLFCPVTDVSSEMASRLIYACGYFIDRTTLQWALEQYCPPGADLRDPSLSPLLANDVTGLPPAHIHTAEFDPFHDEGQAYARRLTQAGVKVSYTCHAGMIHHFYAMAGFIPYARHAIRLAGSAIKKALA